MDTDSLCWTMSTMSVSVFGEEMALENAVDKVFNEIQTAINGSHVVIRSMGMDLDRDPEFRALYEQHSEIEDFVDELTELFK